MELTTIELQTIVMSLDMLKRTTQHYNKQSLGLTEYSDFITNIMDYIEKKITQLENK